LPELFVFLSKLKLIKRGPVHDLLTGKVRVKIDDRVKKAYNLIENKSKKRSLRCV